MLAGSVDGLSLVVASLALRATAPNTTLDFRTSLSTRSRFNPRCLTAVLIFHDRESTHPSFLAFTLFRSSVRRPLLVVVLVVRSGDVLRKRKRRSAFWTLMSRD